MIRIWAKIMNNDKIIKDYMYTTDNLLPENFHSFMVDICYHLDIPTPMVLSSHTNNFLLFNNTKFTKQDFVEKIYFEKLVIENASM